MPRWSALCIVLCLWAGAAFADSAGGAAPILDLVEGSDQDLMLMAVSLDHEPLSDATPCYLGHPATFVPLGELANLLGLAIEVRAGEGIAEGWAYSEDRRFYLELSSHSASFDGSRLTFASTQVFRRDQELYVDLSVLAKLLPIDFNVDLRSATIEVRPREKLPIQEQGARARQMALSLAGRGRDVSDYPQLRLPYSALSIPSVAQTLNLEVDSHKDGSVDRNLGYLTHATGDFLFMQADLTVNGTILTPVAAAAATPTAFTSYGPFQHVSPTTRAVLPDARLRLGRADPYGELLGPLHATEIGIGEVGFPGLDLVDAPVSGTGFLVTNRPLSLPDSFDHHTFHGELPPGWEVELYWNDALIGFQQSRPDGRYEFNSVPLGFGLNTFRLEFHGPQGQVREERQVFDVGTQAVPQGALYYRLTGNAPDASGRRSLAELEYGLTRNLSLRADLATLADGQQKDRIFQTSSLHGYWHFLSGTAGYSTQLGGGLVAMARLQAQLGLLRFSAERDQLWRYQSEYFTSIGPLRSRSSLKIDGALPFAFKTKLPLSLELRRDELVNGAFDDRLIASSSSMFHRLSLTERVSVPLFNPKGLATGESLMSLELGPFALRGGANFDLRPRFALESVSAGIESRGLNNYLWSLGVTRTQTDTKYQASVGKLEGSFGTTLTASWSPQSGATALLSFTISLEHDDRRGGWHTMARDRTETGVASARVFLDSNGNGVMDAGEKALENVQLAVAGQGKVEKTDSGGVAVIGNLAPQAPVDVAIVSNSLDDPYMRPVRAGYRIIPRSGRTQRLEFPVQMTGEIAGTLYASEGGSRRALAGVEIELASKGGKVIKSRTAYDGYYDVPNLVPGHYVLRVAPRQRATEAFTTATRELTVGPDGTVLDGQDLVLNELHPSPVRLAKATVGGEPVIQLPANPMDAFDLPTAEGMVRVRALSSAQFPLASWTAGLPLMPEEIATLDRLGTAAQASRDERLLIVSHAQTLGPLEGALKRATKGGGYLKRYLQAVQMVPARRIQVTVVPPKPELNDPLGHIELWLLKVEPQPGA